MKTRPYRTPSRPRNASPRVVRHFDDSSRPFVFINMAMTADGKIATTNRAVISFSSKRDLEHLYELRSTADAVLNGARTIEITGAKLGPGGERFRRMRLRRGLAEYNLRVIVSGSASIDPKAPLFSYRFSPIVILTTRLAPRSKLRQLRGLADEVMICGNREIDFAFAFRHLRRKWNVRRLLCEGGGQLNAALFRARLVDELHLTVCPLIFGGAQAPTLADGVPIRHLKDAMPMPLSSSRQFGDELFLVYRRGDEACDTP